MALFTLFIVNKSGGLVYNRDLTPGGAKLSGNEVLMAASTFHSLHAISKQLAPVPSGGIASVDAPGFSLHCFESPTGVKFFATARPKVAAEAAAFLRRVYEFYGDYVLKVRVAAAGRRR
jgi:trafficking protein particle complex subunit 4